MGFKIRGGGSGGGGTDDPDLLLDDSLAGADKLDIELAAPDTAAETDDIGPISLALEDTGAIGDDLTAIVGPLVKVFDDAESETEDYLTIDVADATATQDSWIDEGSPDDNHGSDTALQLQQGIILVTDGQRALLAWDFTSLTGWESVPGDTAVDCTLYLSPPAVDVAAELTISADVFDTQPWVENAVTWNNAPAHPDAVGTINYPLLNGPGEFTTTLSYTMDDLAGKWLGIECSFQALIAVIGTFTIRSREHATVATRPRLSFRVRKPL